MYLFYLKLFALSIFCSVFVCTTQAQESYNAQQQAEKIVRKFVWPDGQVPKPTVTSTNETDIEIDVACCVWRPRISHAFNIYLEKETFNEYSSKAKDFILAHEIAHYYLFKVGYLPELIVHSSLMRYLLYFLFTIRNIFGFMLGLCVKYSILIPRLFLQRLIEYEADKQAALVLKDKTSTFDRFKPITPSHKKTAFNKLLEVIVLWLSTHPYDEQRKQALEELTIN